MKKYSLDRRGFLGLGIGIVGATTLSSILGTPSFAADKKPSDMVPETDAVAQALGYKADGKKVDRAKYALLGQKENADASCENCAFYTKVDGKKGKCTMIPTGNVAAKGLCGSWSRKPKV